MSYNGIGLSTAKGSGTSGFVQRTETHKVTEDEGKVYLKRQIEARRTEYEAKQQRQKGLELDPYLVEHERLREIELRVSEYADSLGETDPIKMETLISKFRLELQQPASYGTRINPFESQ